MKLQTEYVRGPSITGMSVVEGQFFMSGSCRQNIEYLTRTGKQHPIKASEKNTRYLKSAVLQRNWQ